jgi:hypothetical protein
MSEGWRKLWLVGVYVIGIGSIELIVWLLGGSSFAAAIGASAFVGVEAAYVFPPSQWRRALGFLGCVNGLTIPLSELGDYKLLMICIAGLIISALLLWWDELKQVVTDYRSKHSDQARRQHLRNVLKDIDAEAMKQREQRARVSEELERLEPKPTYRVATSSDDPDHETESEEGEKPWTTNGEDIYP